MMIDELKQPMRHRDLREGFKVNSRFEPQSGCVRFQGFF